MQPKCKICDERKFAIVSSYNLIKSEYKGAVTLVKERIITGYKKITIITFYSTQHATFTIAHFVFFTKIFIFKIKIAFNSPYDFNKCL